MAAPSTPNSKTLQAMDTPPPSPLTRGEGAGVSPLRVPGETPRREENLVSDERSFVRSISAHDANGRDGSRDETRDGVVNECKLMWSRLLQSSRDSISNPSTQR